MKCPYCGHQDDRVLDTRIQKEGEGIRRRRECLNCKERFSTLETLEHVYPLVVKKDGRREDFNKEKILRGIQAACQKRPVSLAQMEHTVDKLARWFLDKHDKEVSSKSIGLKVMKELRVLDDVAYVRFASVYKTFKDVKEFVHELKIETKTDEVELDENGEEQFKLTPPPSN